MVCLISLLAVNIFGMLHTWGLFLTLWIFWGLTVGHLSQAELLIIVAGLCVKTPKQRSAAKRTSFCPQSLFLLFTLTKRRESPSMLLSDALSLSEAKTSVWISTEWTEAVSYHWRWHHTAQIFKHMHTCWPETSQSCHGCNIFIGQATIQGPQTIPPTSLELKFKRDSGIISPWCLPCRGDMDAETVMRLVEETGLVE